MLETAVDLLVRRINKAHVLPPEHITLVPQLIIRASTTSCLAESSRY